MNKKIEIAIVLILAVLLAIGIVGLIANISPEPHTCPLPSPQEVQKRIGVKADGIIGPETMKAWDKYLCEQYAAEAMEPYVENDGKLHAEWE